jgi:hypothetical protein
MSPGEGTKEISGPNGLGWHGRVEGSDESLSGSSPAAEKLTPDRDVGAKSD